MRRNEKNENIPLQKIALLTKANEAALHWSSPLYLPFSDKFLEIWTGRKSSPNSKYLEIQMQAQRTSKREWSSIGTIHAIAAIRSKYRSSRSSLRYRASVIILCVVPLGPATDLPPTRPATRLKPPSQSCLVLSGWQTSKSQSQSS